MADRQDVAATQIAVDVGQPVHGGHALARYQGRVVFVRHAIPGERVIVQLTDQRRDGYWRGDAVQILSASPDRVPSRWSAAGPGGVGGGELAHITLDGQRRWKRAVVLDAMTRLGGLDDTDPLLLGFEVAAVPGRPDGTGYRTRIELTADAHGRAGMHRYRSHDLVALDSMPLAVAPLQSLDLWQQRWPAHARIDAVAPSDGEPVILVNGGDGSAGTRHRVRERVAVGDASYGYRVDPAGFWQIHEAAPAVLANAVIAGAQVESGMRVVDGYSGAGLFSTPLAHATGSQGEVLAIEADRQANSDARRNAAGIAQLRLVQGTVSAALAELEHRPDVVVLDPPRAGAGMEVMARLGELNVPRVVYVACDPAALARDVALARKAGLTLRSLTGYDLFPHTHHVELLATFTP
ncbi:MAG: class I SAM-dependent RNA methyltransferase [Beutenbergiaceae bacterium]